LLLLLLPLLPALLLLPLLPALLLPALLLPPLLLPALLLLLVAGLLVPLLVPASAGGMHWLRRSYPAACSRVPSSSHGRPRLLDKCATVTTLPPAADTGRVGAMYAVVAGLCGTAGDSGAAGGVRKLKHSMYMRSSCDTAAASHAAQAAGRRPDMTDSAVCNVVAAAVVYCCAVD
jgi:uncharacterized membrane protein